MIRVDGSDWHVDRDGRTWISLRICPDWAHEAKLLTSKISEQGKIWAADIKRHREKRSLDANAYCWMLIGKLAGVLRMSPQDVYRQYIPDVGGNSEIVPVKSGKVDVFCKAWCNGHIGRFCDKIGESKIAGYTNIRFGLGSSDYDTAQMSRLIDLIVDDCKAQGIETKTPREIAELKERWN